MGTNFYLMSRNKKLIREHFAVETEYDIKDIEYAIVDEPYLGYEIHLNDYLKCILLIQQNGGQILLSRKKKIAIYMKNVDLSESAMKQL